MMQGFQQRFKKEINFLRLLSRYYAKWEDNYQRSKYLTHYGNRKDDSMPSSVFTCIFYLSIWHVIQSSKELIFAPEPSAHRGCCSDIAVYRKIGQKPWLVIEHENDTKHDAHIRNIDKLLGSSKGLYIFISSIKTPNGKKNFLQDIEKYVKKLRKKGKNENNSLLLFLFGFYDPDNLRLARYFFDYKNNKVVELKD